MSKSACPDWVLSDTCAVSRDTYNWILQSRQGDRWRAVGYYRTPELLLKSLHRQISRTMPANPDLLQHLETAYKAGERLSNQLSDHINTALGDMAKLSKIKGVSSGSPKRERHEANCFIFSLKSFVQSDFLLSSIKLKR